MLFNRLPWRLDLCWLVWYQNQCVERDSQFKSKFIYDTVESVEATWSCLHVPIIISRSTAHCYRSYLKSGIWIVFCIDFGIKPVNISASFATTPLVCWCFSYFARVTVTWNSSGNVGRICFSEVNTRALMIFFVRDGRKLSHKSQSTVTCTIEILLNSGSSRLSTFLRPWAEIDTSCSCVYCEKMGAWSLPEDE